MADTLASEVARLIRRGWDVIALHAQEKRPKAKAWRESSITADDFKTPCNIGVKCGEPSGWLIDIDLDCAEAQRAAKALLPHTMTHGRPSRPDTHYWYKSANLTSDAYKDVDGKILLEIRSTGAQTMIPPSVHPDGETLTWGPTENILSLPLEDLKKALTRVATVSLLARHWPTGGRHFAAGHVGGFLARLGESVMAVRQMIRLVTEIAGDEEVEDRVRFAAESAERHAKGDRTTGGPSIATSFQDGVAIVALLSVWYGHDGESSIDIVNKAHFVAQLGKSMVVGEEDEDVQFQSFHDFTQRYCNQAIGKRTLGEFWLKHPYRRTFRRAVFAPPGSALPVHEKDYNLWRGFTAAPSDDAAGCARYVEHITDVICAGNTAHADFVLDLFADAVQFPGRIMGKALAVRGPQGVGKSVTFESFGRLFGPHFLALSSRGQIVGDFNSHLSSKVIIFADEAIWGGRREDIGILKSLVTQNRIVIQRKGIDRVAELNCVRLMMATNEDWVWPAGNRERRGVILDVNEQRSPEYFDRLWAEVTSPAFAPALLGLLQRRIINERALRLGFTTPALLEQQEYTADVTQQWWKTVLDIGALDSDTTWPSVVTVDRLYELFTTTMGTGRGAGVVHRGTPGLFIKRLLRLLPEAARLDTRVVPVNVAERGAPVWQNRPARVVALPTLAACRREYNRVTGAEQTWLVPEGDSQPALKYPDGDHDDI